MQRGQKRKKTKPLDLMAERAFAQAAPVVAHEVKDALGTFPPPSPGTLKPPSTHPGMAKP